MNRERLQDIYNDIRLGDKTDMESIRQLTVDYPYYSLPYVILSKHYYQTGHYKFEEMLRQAAMRVKDRKALYDYIHGKKEEPENEVSATIEKAEESSNESVTASIDEFLNDEQFENTALEIPEQEVLELIPESQQEQQDVLELSETDSEKPALEDFLGEPEQKIEEFENTTIIEEVQETVDVPESESKPEEFVLDSSHEAPKLDTIQIDYDIIGEEIETEFSFSKSFGSKDLTENTQEIAPEKEVSETLPDSSNQIVEEHFVDNTATDQSNKKVQPDDSLRKYPIYSIENYFKDEVTQTKSEIEEEPKPEKDFFAWLKSPKSKQIIAEPEAESLIPHSEPINPSVHESIEDEEEENSDSKLDLIDRFISINPQISRPKKEFFNPENMAKRSEVVDLEFVTETLANIYREQGNLDLAIRAYEKLSLQNPSKQAYFANLIEKIKKERK